MSNETDQASDGSIESIVDSILIEPETEQTQEPEEETTEETEQTQDDEVESEDYESDDEDTDDEDDDDEPEEQAGQKKQERLTVKVDGKDVDVTLDDLKRSYSGQAYIQKGMQEAAQARKQAEEAYQTLNAERQQLAQQFQKLQSEGVKKQPTPPSRELLSSDPIGYMEAQAQYQEDIQAYQQQQHQHQQLTRQQTEQQQRNKQARLQQEAEKLSDMIPNFSHPEKGKQLKQDLMEYGATMGYSQDELNNVADARALKLMHDAMMYQKIQKGKDQASEKVKPVRQVVKSGAKRVSDPKGKQAKSAKSKLKRTGSIEDAIELMFE